MADEGRRVQERGLATRAALLDAALECLVEQGYAATTTIEVARRAGVSRGAQLHHFPTKARLLAAAVDHLFERRHAEFRQAFADAEPGADRLDTAIDLLWGMFRGPTFVAWLELWVASRHDPDLRAAVVEVDRRLAEDTLATFTDLFPLGGGEAMADREVAHGFAFALMDGLALRELVPHDHDVPPEPIVGAFKSIARLVVPAVAASPATEPDPPDADRPVPPDPPVPSVPPEETP